MDFIQLRIKPVAGATETVTNPQLLNRKRGILWGTKSKLTFEEEPCSVELFHYLLSQLDIDMDLTRLCVACVTEVFFFYYFFFSSSSSFLLLLALE